MKQLTLLLLALTLFASQALSQRNLQNSQASVPYVMLIACRYVIKQDVTEEFSMPGK